MPGSPSSPPTSGSEGIVSGIHGDCCVIWSVYRVWELLHQSLAAPGTPEAIECLSLFDVEPPQTASNFGSLFAYPIPNFFICRQTDANCYNIDKRLAKVNACSMVNSRMRHNLFLDPYLEPRGTRRGVGCTSRRSRCS